jgi:hypothetical protein
VGAAAAAAAGRVEGAREQHAGDGNGRAPQKTTRAHLCAIVQRVLDRRDRRVDALRVANDAVLQRHVEVDARDLGAGGGGARARVPRERPAQCAMTRMRARD